MYVFLFFFALLSFSASTHVSDNVADLNKNRIVVGAEQFEAYRSLLADKRVGLIVNQTSLVGEVHLIDYLLSKNIKVSKIFAPEHGFRGDKDAGANIDSGIDKRTGIPIISIYGEQKKPTAVQIQDIDVLVFDIQDVGVRFYTYISSMHYMMEAAAENDKTFIVLDRPNPNGFTVDGPVLDIAFQSFVGMHPIPLLHGMTVGELAQMINGEKWLAGGNTVNLHVVVMQNYHHQMHYSLPVKPSPNLPNDAAVRLYPSLALFEGTPVSIGRGTDFPFQVIGYNKFNAGKFTFTPRSIPGAAFNPKLKGKLLHGEDLRQSSAKGFNLDWVVKWHTIFKENGEVFFKFSDFFDKLAGSDELRKQLEAGKSPAEIRQSWQNDLDKFHIQRQPYMLYP